MFLDSVLVYKLRLDHVHGLQCVRRDGKARAPSAVMCTATCGGGERQRACPCFHRALLPCNRLRAGGCDTCDARSDEDGVGVGVGGVLLFR